MSKRPKGLATWNPHSETEDRMSEVVAVFMEYEDQLPLTIRQVLYRLVATHEHWTKDMYDSTLANILNRGRRSGRIPFRWVRDDGVVSRSVAAFDGLASFWRSVQDQARNLRFNRQNGQPQVVEIWVESGGMVPQVYRLARGYGVPVFSVGGFESLTVKHQMARRIVSRDRPTVVLDIGDHDASGVSRLGSAMAEDLGKMVADMGGDATGLTVESALRRRFDLEILEEVKAQEGDARREAVQAASQLASTNGGTP